jgi:hypothetical protein
VRIAGDDQNQVSSSLACLNFTSSEPQAVLSGDATLTNGTTAFSASLASIRNQTISAADTVLAGITGSSNSIAAATDPNAHGFQATGKMGTARTAGTLECVYWQVPIISKKLVAGEPVSRILFAAQP